MQEGEKSQSCFARPLVNEMERGLGAGALVRDLLVARRVVLL